MAEFGVVYTLATPAGTVSLNSGADQCRLSNALGLDGAPIRAPMDNRPQAHGGLVHRFLLGPRHITFEGVFHVTSSGTEAGYVAARNTLITNLQNALNSIYAADGTLTWTPTGGSAQHLYVRHDQPLVTSGGMLKQFLFGLVAADPNPW
jgi:hypothetical protein